MPVKRRTGKHRSVAEAAAWKTVFSCGVDWFGNLARFGGVALEGGKRPASEDVEEAWYRLGATFLATAAPEPNREFWALREFGEPRCR